MFQALNLDELLRVLDIARARRERDFLAILVGFWHGLRASEVVAIIRDDIRDECLDVRRLKGSLRTVQPLVQHANPLLDERSALFDYIQGFTNNQRLFKFGRQHFFTLFRGYASAADLPAHKCHPHVLKHSIAMQTIHSAGIENVRQYLGHKSLSSTGAYLKVTDEESARAITKAIKQGTA